jgi:predicted lipid-binding transport protein (Tim44 family)
MAASDPTDGKSFVSGARRAYELASRLANTGSTKPLLRGRVFAGFSAEIARRGGRAKHGDRRGAVIDSATVDAARAVGGRNEVTVRFVVRLMSRRPGRRNDRRRQTRESSALDLCAMRTMIPVGSCRDANRRPSMSRNAPRFRFICRKIN